MPDRSRKLLKRVERHDLAIARKLALDPRGKAAKWTGRFAELGDQPPLRILSAAVIVAGLAGTHRRAIRTGVRMALAHSLATMAKAFVKDAVDRTRPGEAIGDGPAYRLKPGKSRDPALQSMPSGHSAGVVAVAAAAI